MKCVANGTYYIIPMKFYTKKCDVDREIYFGCRICGRTDLERKRLIWHMKALHEEVLKVIM